MAAHVFVCYARKDLDFVLKLASALKSQGVPLWLDQWDIPHGANWNRTRDNALYDAAQCVVVLSPAAVDSEQVEAEWVTALEEKKHLVPILYQPCRVPSRLRLLQRFDFTNSGVEDEVALSALIRVLGGQRQAVGDSSTLPIPAMGPEVRPETNPSLTSPPLFRDNIGMDFVLIHAGEFLMGSDETNARDDERPAHRVRITKPFYLGKYPVTQAQWEKVMGNNPSRFKEDLKRPVEKVSWNDVQVFLQQLPERNGNSYRLPTEAEWEYAARAGSVGAYCFGDDPQLLRKYAWYDENSDGAAHPVGKLSANKWNLYDMHGNVWEWVQDWYGEAYYQKSPIDDPLGPKEGAFRVFRGGAFSRPQGDSRCAFRNMSAPDNTSCSVGFRVVVLPKL